MVPCSIVQCFVAQYNIIQLSDLSSYYSSTNIDFCFAIDKQKMKEDVNNIVYRIYSKIVSRTIASLSNIT